MLLLALITSQYGPREGLTCRSSVQDTVFGLRMQRTMTASQDQHVAKEDTQQLQSILRRRRGDEAGFIYEAKEYLASSKKAKKLRNKSLKSLNRNEPKTKRPYRSYELVDNLLQPPLRQKSLAQQYNEKQINKLLNGSPKLLGVCGAANDALLQAKEDTQQLQSILRRRRGDEAGFTYEAKEYFASSKKAKKLRNKSLKACKCGFALLENDVEAAFSMLREMESKSTNWSLLSKLMSSKRITHEGEATETNEFEKVDAVLCTLIGPKERSKCGSWALVSKLLHHKRIACEQARRRDINEFENVDAALRSVMSQKMSKSENVEMPGQLKELELCVQDLEDGLECLFRCMIKARVSLLNAFNH
ncbi:hypothetical protein Gotur_021934 [Gossypium turneri]